MKSFDTSMDNNDVSVISGSVILEMEKKVDSKKELISPKKKIRSLNVENKVVFTVLEGYNVKIVWKKWTKRMRKTQSNTIFLDLTQ